MANALGQGKTNFGSYQTFGDLFLDFANPPSSTTEYRRELSLREAVARVGYTAGGVEYTREYFASNPGNVIVARISANQTGRVSFTLRHTSPRSDKTVTASNGRLTIKGALANNGLKFEAQVQVVNQGGTRTDSGDRVTVTGANSVVLVLSAGTELLRRLPDLPGRRPGGGRHLPGHAAAGQSLRRAEGRPPGRLQEAVRPGEAEHRPDQPDRADQHAAQPTTPAARRRRTGRWRRCSSRTAAIC